MPLNVAISPSSESVFAPRKRTVPKTKTANAVGTERIAAQIGKGKFANVNTSIANADSTAAKLTAVNSIAPYLANYATPQFTYLNTLPILSTTEKEIYYYHTDHLGSSAWITDSLGIAVQHLAYLPWGEPFVTQKTGNFNPTYTFSGKERDEETGYSYFGQRFYDSQLSFWLSTDPMREKYPSLTPFNYCANNPLRLVDPNGEEMGPPLKRTISNAVTTTAEYFHDIYLKASNYVKNNPWIIGAANKFIEPISNIVEKHTDLNPETMGWVDLGKYWLFELNRENEIKFGPDAFTTKDLKKQEGVLNAKNEAINNIINGNLSTVSRPWDYGEDEFYSGISEGNVATSFLGSYHTTINIDKAENNKYILNFKVENTSGWQSATRLRKGHQGIIPDKARNSGIKLGGNLKQTWQWTETYP